MERCDDRHAVEDPRPDFSGLASTVISVLRDKPVTAAHTIRTSVVRKLVRATLRDGAFNAEMLLGDLQDGRVAPDQIVDIYIPEAARELGAMWVDDTLSFAAVTIASARLQGLLTLLSPSWTAAPSAGAEGLNTLMIQMAGDTHTLGAHVATSQLRRMGAAVRILFGPDADGVIGALREDRYDLVMVSCSRAESLETLAQLVKRVRHGLSSTPPIALGGLVLNHADRLKDRTGVDLVTGDVKVAFKLCDKQRVKQRPGTR